MGNQWSGPAVFKSENNKEYMAVPEGEYNGDIVFSQSPDTGLIGYMNPAGFYNGIDQEFCGFSQKKIFRSRV
jgi:hypothetical protein